MTPEAALLDANVLYPAPLRDLLMQLAVDGLYRARWSADIDDEWTRNLRAARPALAPQIDRTRAAMHRAIPDALVTGHAALIPDLALPDLNDRHVLAAAIVAEACVIVTFNLRDFPASLLGALGIEAQHPDRFLQALADAEPVAFLAAVRTCLTRLRRPPMVPADYLGNLRAIGLPETAAFLEGRLA